jgi:hypothetical protein
MIRSFATKHALALAHASGGGKCKRRVPYPECNGGRRTRSAQAQRGRLGCLLSRARGRASQQVWVSLFCAERMEMPLPLGSY